MSKKQKKELDSVYFLKMVMYLILGSMWLKVSRGEAFQIPIPVGLITGLLFALHEHFQIDRKIEFALLLHAAFVGFWLPIGIFIGL